MYQTFRNHQSTSQDELRTLRSSAKLIEMGHKPMIMVSPNTTEKERANKINDRNYRELWERLRNRSHDQIQ